MSKLVWDQDTERLYQTGVKNCVLYVRGASGSYPRGVAWNGITGITESPSGAEATALYADDIKYLNLISNEDFGATITAYTYPPEFEECDGSAEIAEGVTIGQQTRKPFGLCYKTTLGNDAEGNAYGYMLHLIYGATASPSERAYATINDSPEAIEFSWEVTTIPVNVTGKKPTASITINSKKADPTKLAALEDILFGADAHGVIYAATTDTEPQQGKTYYTKSGTTYTQFSGSTFEAGTTYYEKVADAAEASDPRLPLPDEIATLMAAG